MEINNEPAGSVVNGDTVFIPRNSSQSIRNTGAQDLIFLCICTPRFRFSNYSAI
jgi:mannose-6-phosphate isomerase-like protein (cupin superfamily)